MTSTRLDLRGMSAATIDGHADICRGKRRFYNRASAKNVARTVKRWYGHTQRPYRCEICGGYHLKTLRK